jgi:hypothetical protein
MMTSAPLAFPEDLKLLLKEGLAKLCPVGIVPREYEALQFCLHPREPINARKLPTGRLIHALGDTQSLNMASGQRNSDG